MPKLKSKKGIRKRIKVTKGGKVQIKRAGKSHLLTTKNRKRKRRLRTERTLGGTTARKIKRFL
ncbi:MAG: 50S ribosomal protein L35 [PVC group bacterium]